MSEIVSAQNFQDKVLNATKPVLVDFFATWCGPCKRVAPVLEEIASEQGDKIDIVKLDIDKDPELASRYGVMSVPTMILFENGAPKTQMVGAQPKAQIVAMINS